MLWINGLSVCWEKFWVMDWRCSLLLYILIPFSHNLLHLFYRYKTGFFSASKDFPDPYKCSLREDFILAEHKYSLSHSQVVKSDFDFLVLVWQQWFWIISFGFFKEILKKVDLLKSFRSLALFFLVDAGVLQVILRNQEIFQKLKLIWNSRFLLT